MRKTMKIIGIMVAVMLIVMTMSTMVSATEIKPGDIANTIKPVHTNAQNDITGLGNKIIGVVTTVGVVVAVVILLVLGIKYMMGSASEKAEYKKTMIPYLVGAVLIFGASAITKVIVSMTSGL